MIKKYRAFAGWFLFAACILVTGAERGYSDALYKASLTGSSASSYGKKIEAKISIKDNGKVELFIKGYMGVVNKYLATSGGLRLRPPAYQPGYVPLFLEVKIPPIPIPSIGL